MSLSLEELKRVFRYDGETGHVYWLVDAGQRGRSGSVAGTTKPSLARYLCIRYNKIPYQTHKIVWALNHGVWPSANIDHINGNSYDNRVENLRLANQQENNKNAKNRKDNKSGIRGVCWNEYKKRWISQIGVNGKVIQTGAFLSFFGACCSRKSAEIKYGFHPNHGRA